MMAFSSDVDLAKLGSSGSDTDGQPKKPAAFSTQLYNSLVNHQNTITCRFTITTSMMHVWTGL